MDKQKKQLVMTGILLVIFVLALSSSFKKKPRRPAAVPAAAPAVVAPAPGKAAVVSAPVEGQGPLQPEYSLLPWGRDPFLELIEKEYKIDEFQLKGISFGKDQKGFAFINDEIVKKGDTIGEYEVAEIEKDRVFLKRENQSFYLTFPEN
jgi:hypothetical protein